MRRLFTFIAFIVMFLNCTSILAYDISFNGIHYNITSSEDKTVEVASYSDCSGNVVIPHEVSLNGSIYIVTGIGYGAFYGCSSLKDLDLSGFNTSNVTDMSEMFHNCSNLNEITFGEYFKTNNVTTINSMFNGCSKLTSLDVSGFDTSKVINMGYMFLRL
mgnify:CR=1 FL=1